MKKTIGFVLLSITTAFLFGCSTLPQPETPETPKTNLPGNLERPVDAPTVDLHATAVVQVMAAGWDANKLDQSASGNPTGSALADRLASLGVANPWAYSVYAPHFQCAAYVDAIVAQGGGRAITSGFAPGPSVSSMQGKSGLQGAVIATFNSGRYPYDIGLEWGHVAFFKEWIPGGVRVWDANWVAPGASGIHEIYFGSGIRANNLDNYAFVLGNQGGRTISVDSSGGSGGGVAFPSAPTVQEPGSGSAPGSGVQGDLTFKWGAVSGASSYGLYVSKEPYGGANLVYNNDNVSGTSVVIPATTFQPGVKYRWNMTAFSGGTNGNFSSTLYFTFNGTVQACDTPPYPFNFEINDNDTTRSGLYPQYFWQDNSNGSSNQSWFTYNTNTQENWAQWRFKPTGNPHGAAVYDIYAFMPNPSSNNGLAGYGANGLAKSVKYKLKNNDANQFVNESPIVSQAACQGSWKKIMSDLTLYDNVNWSVELPDNVYNGAAYGSEKVYFDNIGVKKTRDVAWPRWSVGPAPTFSGQVGVAAPAAKTVTVRNEGGAAGDFGITADKGWISLNNPGGSRLDPNGTRDVTVSVSACTAVASETGTITVTGNGETAVTTLTRQCTPQPVPAWGVQPALVLPAGTVGSSGAISAQVTVTNVGSGAGSFGVTSSKPAEIGVSMTDANPVAALGGTRQFTVTAPACSVEGTQSSSITITGDGSTTSMTASRVCNPQAPASMGSLSIIMSSAGKMLLMWPEAARAKYYTFTAKFNGQNVPLSGQANAGTGSSNSAVATFLNAPDATDKQGKQVCFTITANNVSGSSSPSEESCIAYRYFAPGISVQSVNPNDGKNALKIQFP
jgi:hypothetical protein